jgi:hypothetical protein
MTITAIFHLWLLTWACNLLLMSMTQVVNLPLTSRALIGTSGVGNIFENFHKQQTNALGIANYLGEMIHEENLK